MSALVVPPHVPLAVTAGFALDSSACSVTFTWPRRSGRALHSSATAPCDDFGHGTHVMGTGVGDDKAGNQIGVAPRAKWIGCRNMEEGVGRPSSYLECFDFFLAPWDSSGGNPDPARAPHVIGNSWSCPLGAPPQGEGCVPKSLRRAVNTARAAGIFVVASAGNEGPGCSTIAEPAGIHAAVDCDRPAAAERRQRVARIGRAHREDGPRS